MASATIETFCCMTSNVEPSILSHLQFQSLPYNIVCVVSSICGMMGAIYQVLPTRSGTLPNRHRNIGHTQRAIINWLAMVDFFAASGILLRSAFWIWNGDISQDGWYLIVCALLAYWIRFFYTAAFMWTLFYAVDVYLVCKQKAGNQKLYHTFVWSASLVLTTTGLGTLYLPDFQCHSGPWRVMPNYLLSYIPIVCVMIINPILYYISSKNVRILLTGGLGQLTYLEHNLLAALREKFFCIVLVYYVCWIPNVLNGILLWGFWGSFPRQLLIGVWYVMAVVNPLQAVLNSLVYKGWDGCQVAWKSIKWHLCCCKEAPDSGLIIEPSISDVNFTSERPTFSTNNRLD